MVVLRTSLRLPLLAGASVLALICAPAARAHGIQSTVERLGSLSAASPYQLESHFSSGLPARDAAVRIVSPDGAAAVALGTTNAEGQLTFRLPAQARSDWEVQIDAGPGHRDYIELPGATPAPLHSRSTPSPGHLMRSARSLGALAVLGSLAGLLLHRPRR